MRSVQEQSDVLVFTGNPFLVDRIRGLFPSGAVQIRSSVSSGSFQSHLEGGPVHLIVFDTAEVPVEQIADRLKQIETAAPGAQVILLIRDRGIPTLRGILETGVIQYAKFPLRDEELRILMETALYRASHALGPTGVRPSEHVPGLVGRSERMKRTVQSIKQAAGQDISVLLLGETGTGKDLAAHAIHQMSARNQGPFVPVNLGALPTDLVASELFGHEKGAFTGATQRISGRFEQAAGGTIFLDEIDSVNEKVQIGLLRILEHMGFHRIGGKGQIQPDCRIIAASNVSFHDLLERNNFRNDLLFRLDVFRIQMPALRDCTEDIPLLAQHFLRRYSVELNKSVNRISGACMDTLTGYDWPGNVRELKNVIQRAVLVSEGDELLVPHLPDRFRHIRQKRSTMLCIGMGVTLEQAEKQMVEKALELTRDNRTRAAEILGITRRSLYNKLKKHGLL